MSERELYEMLKTLGLPVAYDHFVEAPGASVQPPFILYKIDSTTNFKADDRTFSKSHQYIIDLVTDKKDVDLEETLEDLLDQNYLPYDKEEDYIESEKIFQIRYFI